MNYQSYYQSNDVRGCDRDKLILLLTHISITNYYEQM